MMFKFGAILGLSVIIATGSALAEDKERDGRAGKRRLAPNEVVTLTNGTGDGKVTLKVDGYGTFGSSTNADDAIYNPIGPIGASRTVFESSVFFSPARGFLSTDSISSPALPPISMRKIGQNQAISEFTIAGYKVKLTQFLRPAGANGSTLVQAYAITNLGTTSQTIQLVRHVDGDLYFNGGYTNDFGGVSADEKTLFEFDTGDNPSRPTTYLGITSTGGRSGGFTIQPYRYTDEIVAAGGIPASANGTVYRDANDNGVTDTTYDITLSQQNSLTIGAGRTVTYRTYTIFGQGSIIDSTSAASGCLKLNNQPLVARPVIAKQPGVANKTTQTDANGCFGFSELVNGKAFTLEVGGPVINN